MSPFWSPYDCDPAWCSQCLNGWYCASADSRRSSAARLFASLTEKIGPCLRDGWWSDFDRGWRAPLIRRVHGVVALAVRRCQQMLAPAARRRQKRRGFVHALRAA